MYQNCDIDLYFLFYSSSFVIDAFDLMIPKDSNSRHTLRPSNVCLCLSISNMCVRLNRWYVMTKQI